MNMRFLQLVVAIMIAGGCATEHHVTDARHPDIAIMEDGGVTFRGRNVDPEDLPGLLRDTGFTRKDTINIHYPDGQSDFHTASRVMTVLLQGGFPRTVLVGDRKSYSYAGPGKPGKGGPTRFRPEAGPSNAKPRVRYK